MIFYTLWEEKKEKDFNIDFAHHQQHQAIFYAGKNPRMETLGIIGSQTLSSRALSIFDKSIM